MRCIIVAVAAAVAVLMAVAVSADTFTTTTVVRAADLQSPGPHMGYAPATGWVVGMQDDDVNNEAPQWHMVVGTGASPPAGLGSFYFYTTYKDADPLQKVYLGTNNHNGVALADIVTFKYYTYLQNRDYGASGTPLGQPPMLELITDSGATTQRRRFVYKPYGPTGNNNAQLNVWQEWDLMAPGGRWELLQTGSTNYFGNWDWLKIRYTGGDKGMRIQSPLVGDYKDGVPVVDGITQALNQSGTSISIKVGSGQAQDSRYPAWWRESCGVKGMTDKLVIGISDGQGNVNEYVYDFEPFSRAPVATSNRSAIDAVADAASADFPFVVCGKVLTTGYSAGQYFTVDDGSGMPIRIWAVGHDIPEPSEWDFYYARGMGQLSPTTVPPTLYSHANLIYRYQ